MNPCTMQGRVQKYKIQSQDLKPSTRNQATSGFSQGVCTIRAPPYPWGFQLASAGLSPSQFITLINCFFKGLIILSVKRQRKHSSLVGCIFCISQLFQGCSKGMFFTGQTCALLGTTPLAIRHRTKCVGQSWASLRVTADLGTAAGSTESHAEVSHMYLLCLCFLAPLISPPEYSKQFG